LFLHHTVGRQFSILRDFQNQRQVTLSVIHRISSPRISLDHCADRVWVKTGTISSDSPIDRI
jgi:hypothetical protein